MRAIGKSTNRGKPLEVGDRVLLFVIDGDVYNTFWIELAHLGTDPQSRNTPYDNEMNLLTSETAILDGVKRRVALEKTAGETKRRGLLVEFTSTSDDPIYHDFVRTADPAYKAALVKQLKAGPSYISGTE